MYRRRWSFRFEVSIVNSIWNPVVDRFHLYDFDVLLVFIFRDLAYLLLEKTSYFFSVIIYFFKLR